MASLRRITDGVIFQAVLTGSLSFSHIHDVAAAHGQDGWKAWLYPLSVDLLTVAAYRKITAAHRADTPTPTGLAWCAFLLGLTASLAANVAEAWNNPDRTIAVALGVWPAVAFLVCTLLSHDPQPAPAPTPAAVPVPAESAVVAPVQVTAPAPAAAGASPVPAAPARPLAPELADLAPAFLAWARRVAEEYRQTHDGTPIDPGTLRARLKVAEPLALAVHHHLMTTTEPIGA
jgi:hypothetical protein